jgi:hypothetical protein
MRDNDKLLLGNDDDLAIFHDGSNSNIYDNGTGSLILRTNQFFARGIDNQNNTSTMIQADVGGGVKLYYDNLIKFETLSGGSIVRGNLAVTEDLQVSDNLTVNDNANFANGSVVISQNTVTAPRFAGEADQAGRCRVYGTEGQKNAGNLTTDEMTIMMIDSNIANGAVTTLMRDLQLKFNIATNELKCEGDVIAFNASDERLKDNIKRIEDPLAKVISISGNTFTWNEEKSKKTGEDTGVIAQEIEALGLPGITKTRNDGYVGVRYEKLVPLLIEAIKELNDKVSALEDKLNN